VPEAVCDEKIWKWLADFELRQLPCNLGKSVARQPCRSVDIRLFTWMRRELLPCLRSA